MAQEFMKKIIDLGFKINSSTEYYCDKDCKELAKYVVYTPDLPFNKRSSDTEWIKGYSCRKCIGQLINGLFSVDLKHNIVIYDNTDKDISNKWHKMELNLDPQYRVIDEDDININIDSLSLDECRKLLTKLQERINKLEHKEMIKKIKKEVKKQKVSFQFKFREDIKGLDYIVVNYYYDLRSVDKFSDNRAFDVIGPCSGEEQAEWAEEYKFDTENVHDSDVEDINAWTAGDYDDPDYGRGSIYVRCYYDPKTRIADDTFRIIDEDGNIHEWKSVDDKIYDHNECYIMKKSKFHSNDNHIIL